MRSGQDFASGRLHAIKSVCGWVESISRRGPYLLARSRTQKLLLKSAPWHEGVHAVIPIASAATRQRAAKLELWTYFFSDDCNPPCYFPCLPQLAPELSQALPEPLRIYPQANLRS